MEHAPTQSNRKHVLAMGFAMCPLGFIFGFINTAMPILLAAQNTPVHIIANVSVIAFLPTSLGFVLCPVLDVRFTRRFYMIVCALLGGLSLAAAVMEYQHIIAFTALATFSCTAAVMYGNALGGWSVDALPSSDYGWLGAWGNVANLGAAGCFGSLTVFLIRGLALPVAAGLVGAIILLPLALLVFFPAPVLPHRSIEETFHTFFRDIFKLLGQRSVLLGLAAFLLPASCFALSNLFSGPNSVYNFVPQISQPIFTAGRLKSNVKLAEAQRDSALVQYERAIQTAFGEVSNALIAHQRVRESRIHQQALAVALEDRKRLSYMRYRGGVDTQLNALDADRDLFQAQLTLAQLNRNEILSVVQLYKALGGGWK